MKNNEPTINIQESFDLTLVDSNLDNIAFDFTELSIDCLLDDGLLKDIPVVSTFVNLIKFGVNVHDKLFLKKILSFLSSIKEIPVETRKRMIQNIDDSKKYRVKVGEKLFYIIDSCSDFENSERVAKAFKFFIEGKIKYDEFVEVANVLERLSTKNFGWFIKERKNTYFELDEVGDLISSGLFELFYEQVSVRVEDETDRKVLLERGDKYKTDVNGGVNVNLSRSGEIILEIFCATYEK